MSEADRDGGPVPPEEPDNWTEVDIDAAFAAIVARYGRSSPQIGPWPVAEDVEAAGTGKQSHPASTGHRGTEPAEPATKPAQSPTDHRGTDVGEPADVPASDPSPPARSEDGTDRASGSRTESWAQASDPSTSVWDRHAARPNGPSDPGDEEDNEGDPGDEEDDEGDPGDEEDNDRYVPPAPPPLPRGDFLTTLAWVGVLGGPLFLLIAALAWHDMPAELILAGVAAFIGGFVLLVARMPNEHPDDPDDGAVV